MRALPENLYIREIILKSIEDANKFARSSKIPSHAEPIAWIDKHNIQVVSLKLTKANTRLFPDQFQLIGKMQLILLKTLKKKGNKIKVSFVVDSGHIILDKNYLSPLNYENIAKRLLQESIFESEVMIIRPGIISTFLKAGVLAISRLVPGSTDRFFVVGSLKEARELLLKHYS